ncbi:hypothetical unknown protein [Scheffersomyces stipitis CBS 6054]|uniref:PH domain-containing protein n=1 Tax=Scheffersomyces stipitis (strain ATCC 58785 / CBS 6054 / NBRC 10063 / NRRL Y-11545) TaxID=322104 RepID=A3LVC1_PICST|nr:hypothetical unknown protein [Scheffersomyces stipitis CBS 6054]ABN67094.2 hypothetical unknown protein [Scheffersomyces stipitis CBS 6054]KAG2734259.1 hypothetical protein G9P44_002265 [Scheffersomyces stipitis]
MLSVAGCSMVEPLAPSVLYSDTKDKTLLSSTTSSSDLSPTTSSSSNSQSSSRAQSPIKQASSTSDEDINSNASDSGSRPDTPPTPSSISTSTFTKVNNDLNNFQISQQIPNQVVSKKTKHFTSHQDSFLQLIEPFPVHPPHYSTLPPGGCPRFPISLRPHSVDEQLPTYTPSVYKLGIVSRKLEWLTPYEPSPTRSWKSVIMELNSTQLSFYAVPSTLENHLLAFRPVTLHGGDRTRNEFDPEELRNVESHHTTDGDLQFYKMCQRLNLIGTAEDSKKNSNSKKLIRSYSLQHARVGLATDYRKRPNVLRLRIESEQILVYFPTTKDLIEWNMAIGIGKDIALDLNERELPRYRTVPRRRRRDRNGDEAANYEAQYQALIQQSKQSAAASQNSQNSSRGFRLRSQSDPNSRFRDKLSKLKSKLSVSSTQSTTIQASAASASRTFIDPTGFSGTQSYTIASTDNSRFSNLEIARSNSSPNFTLYNESEYEDESAVNSTYEYDEDDYDEEIYEVMTRSRNQTSSSRTATRATQRTRANTTSSPVGVPSTGSNNSSFASTVIKAANEAGYRIDYEDEDDIQNLSDLHQTDEEDEYEEDEVVDSIDDEGNVPGVPSTSNRSRKTSRRTSSSSQKPKKLTSIRRSLEDQKWQPPLEKVQSKRKYYRNCLRCIKPLTMEDSWTSKSLVKPTTLSPLNFAYLKNIKYNGELSISSSTTSLISLSSTVSSQNSTNESTSGFRKNRSFSFKEINGFNLPDSALTKVTNHFLKEYVVGAHGLIPKDV